MKNIGLLLLVILFAACGTGGKGSAVSGLVSLDEALADIEERLESGVIIALLNFSSPSERFSEYVLEGLSEHLVNGGKLVVVERNQLDLIRQEEQFQLSGEVSDESAQAIGKKLGAQMIVSGTLSDVGKSYRLRIKTLVVETAAIATTSSSDISAAEERVVYLLAGAKPPVEPESQEDTFPEGLLFEIVDGRSITITKYIGSDTTVQIPALIDGLPVTVIGDRAFSSNKVLTSIAIPSSVTIIGEYVFEDCENLTSVIIPPSVTVIGDGAFLNCRSLISVTIPPLVTTIGKGIFFQCENLTTVTIPSSVIVIGEYAFRYCTNLTSINVDARNGAYRSVNGVLFDKSGQTLITYPEGKSGEYNIPSSVTIIGKEAFVSCRNLTSVIIPYSVTVIEEQAFSYCSSLTSVTIPSGVKTIKLWAFIGCTGLTKVNISPVATIADSVFSGCENLTEINLSRYIPLNNEERDAINFSSIDGVLFDRSGRTLLLFPPGKKGAYTIPSSVTIIGYRAFYGCKKLTSVTIPPSVITIMAYAFYDTSLTSVTIPSSVTTIGKKAFDPSLRTVTLFRNTKADEVFSMWTQKLYRD